MQHSAKFGFVTILAASISVTVALAGPTTGIPPFRSFGGGHHQPR
jgi:hypothetical protein